MTPETQTPVERVSDLDGLEALARAIGAASANLFDVTSRTVPGWQKNSTAYNDAVGALAGARNAFNAAANPAVVLSLITRLRAAEAATAAAVERAEKLEPALTLALDYLGEHEPGDSRAVSNEYVAMAAVLCDVESNTPGEDMAIIQAALRARGNPNAAALPSTPVAGEAK